MITCCTACQFKFEIDEARLFQLIRCEQCDTEFRALWYVRPSTHTLDLSDDADDQEPTKKTRKTTKEIVAETTVTIQDEFSKILPKIKEAIDRDENESGTRLILDRIIQNVLGYKLEDIKTEQKIQGKKADYILSLKGEDVLVVEAKRVNLPLKARHVHQATAYGAYSGIQWALLTNAAVWQLYRIVTAEKVKAQVVFTVDVRDGLHDGNLRYFYLLSTHGMGRTHLLEKLWEKTCALSPDHLTKAILTDDVITKIRTTLYKDTGCKLTNDDVRAALENDLLHV